MNPFVLLSTATSTGQSFYVPWDMSYLNMFKNFFSVGIGAIIVVGILGGAFYFGVRFIGGLLADVFGKR